MLDYFASSRLLLFTDFLLVFLKDVVATFIHRLERGVLLSSVFGVGLLCFLLFFTVSVMDYFRPLHVFTDFYLRALM